MWENTQEESVSEKPLSRAVIAKMLQENFEKLPAIDQKFFMYGSLYLGGNAAFAGLIANSLFRRALNVKASPFLSSMSASTMSFFTTYAMYCAAVTVPILNGGINCPTCCVTRGALVGVVGGALYPIIVTLPLNLFFASRYNTTPMPEDGARLRFAMDTARPVLRKMRPVMVLQAIFGAYLGSRDFETYTKLVKITFGQDNTLPDEEEVRD